MIVAEIMCKFISWVRYLCIALIGVGSLYMTVSILYLLLAGNIADFPTWEHNAFWLIGVMHNYL